MNKCTSLTATWLQRLLFLPLVFIASLAVAQVTVNSAFQDEDAFQCGENFEFINVAASGFSAGNNTVCIDLAALGINPNDVADDIRVNIYYDRGFNGVTFSTSNGATAVGTTNAPFGPGGTQGDHFAFATLPNDGSTMICATASASNAGLEDISFFGIVPVFNSGFCNSSFGGFVLDNEIFNPSAGECEIGTIPLVPTGDGSELVDVTIEFSVSEVEPNDPRIIQAMFEACGVVIDEDAIDPIPTNPNQPGFALISFTLENVPSDCAEISYEFCSPPSGGGPNGESGQSFGIGILTATIECVPECTASTSGPVCAGEPAQLFAVQICGSTYDWSGPNGFSSTDEDPA